MANETAVLLISCPDQKGLVAGVSNFIYRNGGNIVHADQHIDPPQGIFFQRVEWELSGFALANEAIGDAFKEICLGKQDLVDAKLLRRPGGDLGWLDQLDY